MILWIILFVLILAISFVLAVKSMHDFQEIHPQTGENFSLFLIRNTPGLNKQLIEALYDDLAKSKLTVSFERLFKGPKSALVIFGPKTLLTKYTNTLNLLELEDYTDIDINQTVAWEMTVKDGKWEEGRIPANLPTLSEQEQFWWQVIAWINDKENDKFSLHIRAVVTSVDQFRLKELAKSLQNLASARLVKLPKAFSNAQLLDFYKKRSFIKGNTNLDLNPDQILQLISLN